MEGRCLLLAVWCLSGCPGRSIPAVDEPANAESIRTLVHDGAERSYLVRVPPRMDPGRDRVPLVLVLHGGGGDARHAERVTGFTRKAEQEGFVVVYPEGTGRLDRRWLTWNAGHCCGSAMKQGVDDVGFIRGLLERLITEYPIDPGRIYVTGMSNGGMMAHRLGIELSDRIAAIAPVVATMFGDESKPRHPVSALIINGALDRSVPVDGGSPGGSFAGAWDGTLTRPVTDQAVFWANANGCPGPPETHEDDACIRWRYPCPGRQTVEFYLVKDNGHAWPGGQRGSRLGDQPGTSVNATDIIWAFFRQHAR